jgi:signal transduction histidine kinase/CheY-like chemotaxis protein/DICT domain-containing protein
MLPHQTAPTPVSLFNLVQQRLGSDVSAVPCTKATLAHWSHTLEDLVLQRRIPAMIFRGFNESSHTYEETERCGVLAEIAQQVCIFTCAPCSLENQVAALQVAPGYNAPLRQECFLIILCESFSVILCGQNSNETMDHYEALWSFEPVVVNTVFDLLEGVIGAYQPERLAQVQAARANLPPFKPDLGLMTQLTLEMARSEGLLSHRQEEDNLPPYQAGLEAQITQRTLHLAQANEQLKQEGSWFSTTKVPLRDNGGQIIGLVGMSRDITRRKQIEEEVQQYRDHLEGLVAERTAELEAANQQLQGEIAERQRIEAERETLLAAEREQRLLAEILQEVTLALTSHINHTEVLDEILRQAQRLVPYNTAHITLLQGSALRIVRWQGYDAFNSEEFITNLYQPLADFPLEQAIIQTCTSRIIEDTWLEPLWTVQSQTSWVRSHLVVPISLRERILGLLRLDSDTPGQFSTKDAERLQALANAAAIALEHAHLYAETQKQARQLEQILNSVRTGILLIDHDYCIQVANPAGQEYLALLAGIEVGQICTHLGDRPLPELLQPPSQGTYHEVTPSGNSHLIFEVNSRPTVDSPEIEGWVVLVRDITEERNIQKRIQQQEKLAAVGQLAAGIAHDFNNILTSMIGFAELARYTPELPDSVGEDLGQIVRQGQRAAHLVRQILDFARKNMSARRPLEFSVLLKETIKLLERTIPETIRVELKIDPGQNSYMVNADLTQMQQVLTNLALNAADAMPIGGILQFHLSAFSLTSGQRSPWPGIPPGDWLVLSIVDTGVGIPPEIQAHIFEPFFTTKEIGKGTGLGLAQVDGIIKQHEGYIYVDSQVGHGTTFTICLPLLNNTLTVANSEPLLKEFSGQGETILLVEDDDSVLRVIQAVLLRLGYRVITATNGRDALRLYEQSQQKIALVVTDLTMPEMGGIALADALLAANHGARIMAMTGYPLKMDPKDLLDHGIIDWLQKPPDLELLARKLKQALTIQTR